MYLSVLYSLRIEVAQSRLERDRAHAALHHSEAQVVQVHSV